MAFILVIILFIASVLGIGTIIVRKIPLVLATPREVVNDYLEQSSSRISVRLLRVRSWFKNGAYWQPTLAFLLRALRYIRAGLLRLDHYLFNLSQRVSQNSKIQKMHAGEEKFPISWDELKTPSAPAVRDNHKPEAE